MRACIMSMLCLLLLKHLFLDSRTISQTQLRFLCAHISLFPSSQSGHPLTEKSIDRSTSNFPWLNTLLLNQNNPDPSAEFSLFPTLWHTADQLSLI